MANNRDDFGGKAVIRQMIVLVSALGFLVVGKPSVAQSGSELLEEIVVTAQRREQNIQDVPSSISALSNKNLRDRGVDDIRGYSDFVPGMIYNGTPLVGERSGPDITIRGIANSRLFDFETSIATATTAFVFGQMPAYSFDPRLADISRVEVLKGPQGTLYGASSMGGTVKVVPNAPDASGFSASVTGGLGYTNDGAGNTEFSGVVNVPFIEDVLAVRMSGYRYVDSGYIDARMVVGDPNEERGGIADFDIFDPNDTDVFNVDEPTRNFIENINEVETIGGMVAAKYTPNEKLETTLSVMFQSKDERSSGNFEPGLSSNLNERTTELYVLQPSSTDYFISQLEVSYDLSFADLHSVTGGLNRKFTNATDFSAIVYGTLGGDGTVPVPGTATVNFIADIDVFSQEFRLQGNAEVLAGLDWTVGYFYQKEDRLATGSVPVSASWIVNGAADGLLPPSGSRLVWAGEYTSEYTNNSFFVDVSLSLTDEIQFSVGARTSNQDLSSRRLDFGNVFAGASTPDGFTDSSQSFGEDQTTPRVALTWNTSDDVMLYASAAEGFRIGGANPTGNLDTPGCQNALSILGITEAGAFESDSVWNYEVGARTQFADNRVRLNVSAFQVDWTDLQVATALTAFDPTCGASIVANVGAAEVRGIELDLEARLLDNLQVGLVAEFNDAELTRSSPGVPGAQPGDPLKSIPDYSVALGLQYDFMAIAGTDAYARLDYVYMDDRSFSDIAAGPSDAFALPSYDLLNFRIGATFEDWDIVAYVDNVSDETPQLGVTLWPRGPGIFGDGSDTARVVNIGRPRTGGVRVTKRF